MQGALIDNISVGQAMLMGIIGGLAMISWIYSFMFSMRALIVSALIGAVLGHAQEAIIFGAAAELIYLGLINAAGVVPPNPLGPGIFGVVILLSSKDMTTGSAITLSLPFAIFIQFLVTIIFTIVSPIGDIGAKLIAKNRITLYRLTGHTTAALLFVAGFLCGIAGGLGHKAFGEAIAKIPVWFQKGLGIGGGMLPAMGLAVVLRLMLKREYIPFLFVGYTLVVIFQGVGAAKPEWGFNLVALVIATFAIVLVVFYSGLLTSTSNRQAAHSKAAQGGTSDGI